MLLYSIWIGEVEMILNVEIDCDCSVYRFHEGGRYMNSRMVLSNFKIIGNVTCSIISFKCKNLNFVEGENDELE